MNQLYLSGIAPNYINVKMNKYRVKAYNLNNKYLILKYETKNRYKDSKLYYESKIPIKIPLNCGVLRALGLLEAEMTKTEKSNNIVFSNSEPIAINFIMQFFNKYFQVKFNEWGQLIEFNRQLINYENRKETISREHASRLFWINNTKISDSRFFRKWCIYRGQERINKLNTKNKWGMLYMQHGNILLLKVILNILSYINKNYKYLSKKQLYSYLDGIFSGDGGIMYKDHVRFVYLTSYNYNFIKKINELLRNKLELYSHINSKHVVAVSNVRDLYMLYKYGLFNLNIEKRYKLLKSLMSYKEFQGRGKLIEKQFNATKVLFDEELYSLKHSIEEREKYFYRFYISTKKKIKHIDLNFEIEIKLSGLFRKPTIFKVSNIICDAGGITIREVKAKTGLSLSSIYHATNRLLKNGYVLQDKYNCPNLKVFPTKKLIKDIKIANKLQLKFNDRYGGLII